MQGSYYIRHFQSWCHKPLAAVEIGFVETAVTVGEGAGQVVVNVALLIGTLEREVSVDVITLDGTAVGESEVHGSSG